MGTMVEFPQAVNKHHPFDKDSRWLHDASWFAGPIKVNGWATAIEGELANKVGRVTHTDATVTHLMYEGNTQFSTHRTELLVGLSRVGPLTFASEAEAEAWVERTLDEQWKPKPGLPCWVGIPGQRWPGVLIRELRIASANGKYWKVAVMSKDGPCEHEHSLGYEVVLSRRLPDDGLLSAGHAADICQSLRWRTRL